MPEDGDLGADVLRLEAALRRDGVAELKKVKQLEDENRRLKSLVADLTLDKQMLQEVLKGKW